MKDMQTTRRKRWTLIWLAVMLTLTVAFAQSRFQGNLQIQDPIYSLQNSIYNLNYRVIAIEDELAKEIQARKDLEKRVVALEKLAPKVPIAKKPAAKALLAKKPSSKQ